MRTDQSFDLALNSNLLGELTIVIPSYGRQSFLRRQSLYWSALPVNIIVLDGSPTAATNLNIGPRFQYYHLPLSIEDRFKFVANKVNTKYAALLSDDELFLPLGLQDCIGFLERNPDYVSCKGRALGFSWKEGVVRYKAVYPGLSGYCINALSPRDRVFQHMNPYQMATLWAVMKQDVFVKTLAAMGAGPRFSSAAIGEIQTSIIAAYMGKCAVIDSLMWLRSFENPNIWWNDGRQSVEEWYGDVCNILEHERFNVSIASVLCLGNREDSVLPLSAVKVYISGLHCNNGAVAAHSIKKVVKNFVLNSSFAGSLAGLLRRVKNNVLSVIGFGVQSFSGWHEMSPEAVAKEMRKQGIHVEMSDLLYFAKSINGFYSGI